MPRPDHRVACHAVRMDNLAVRRRRAPIRALVPFGVILVVVGSASVASAHNHDTTEMNIDPRSGPAGTTVTVTGSRFSTGAEVQIRWGGSGTSLLLATTTGPEFSVEVTVPHVRPGDFQYGIVATDFNEQTGEWRGSSAPFQLDFGGPLPPVRPTEAFCVNVEPSQNSFSDDDGTTFEALIECLAHSGITAGGPGALPPNQYGPGLPVTRAQMASFVVRELDTAKRIQRGSGLGGVGGFDGSNDFVDVASGNVHLEAINRLSQAGVAAGGPGGRPANEFGPDLPVTRAQMASFIDRAHQLLTGATLGPATNYFTDDAGLAHEASINGVALHGIAVGDGSSIFHPQGAVNRGQMAAFLIRHLAMLEVEGFITPLP